MMQCSIRSALVVVVLLGGCPGRTVDRRDPHRPDPAVRDEVLVFGHQVSDGKTVRSRFTPVRLLRDGRLATGRVWTLELPVIRDTKAQREGWPEGTTPVQDFLRVASATHDDRYLYRVVQSGEASRAGSCVVERLELFGRGLVTIPLPTSTCPTAIVAVGGRVMIGAKQPDGVRRYPSTRCKEDLGACYQGRRPTEEDHRVRTFEERTRGRMIVGELLPAGAPTRVEWFFTSHLSTPPDFLVGTPRTLVVMDNTVHAAVFDLRGPGRPRYRYTALTEDPDRRNTASITAAATTDDTLFLQRPAHLYWGAAPVLQAEDVLTYAITDQGLVPKAMPRHEYYSEKKPPRDARGEILEPAAWAQDIGILGDRLVFAARRSGLAHLPLAVKGGWWYQAGEVGQHGGGEERTTVGRLCDDAQGQWACRRVDLARTHPAHVGKVPPFEFLPLGGGDAVALRIRNGRAYVVVRRGLRPAEGLELVVVSRDRVEARPRVERRIPLDAKLGERLVD